jgi:hypothetical protein
MHILIPKVLIIDAMGRMHEHECRCFARVIFLPARFVQFELCITDETNMNTAMSTKERKCNEMMKLTVEQS